MMHDPLRILVERLHEAPQEHEYHLQPEELELDDPAFDFTGPVKGQVRFSMAGQDVLAAGRLRFPVAGECVRCLERVERELTAEVTETWIHEGDDPHVEAQFSEEGHWTGVYSGPQIHLGERWRELIMAELPERLLCDEACRGLCPQCGGNLNRGACSCEREPDPAAMPEWKRKLRGLRLD